MSALRSRRCCGYRHIIPVLASLGFATLSAAQECPCLGDLDGSGAVDGADLGMLLGAWGACGDCGNCPADLTGDCAVSSADLAILLGSWGLCTETPVNDLCASATVVTLFTGSANPFCTRNATTDGPPITACSAPSFSEIENDVWFRVTMPLSGVAQFGVCGDFDVRVAIYGPNTAGNCACPSGAPGVPLIGCATTAVYPSCPTGAALLVDVVAGQCYTVRIGGAPGQSGSGNLDINFFVPPCAISSQTSLAAAGLEASTQFGIDVDISGDIAIASAIFDDVFFGISNAGSARVYRYDGVTWNPEQSLFGPSPFATQRFGVAVAVAGNRIVVGAGDVEPGCTADPDCDTGAAFLFEYDGKSWELVKELLPSGGSAVDKFGARVDIDGTRTIVAAWDDTNVNGTRAGAAYIWERFLLIGNPIWLQTAKLIASDGEDFDRFGSDVAVSGARAIVGADSAGSGAAYFFDDTTDGWIEVAKVVPPDLANAARFGSSVALSGDIAVVGAPQFNGTGGGRAYVYERFDGFGWLLVATLAAFDGSSGGDFGARVSIEGSQIIVGAPGDAGDSGSAYVFWRVSGGWVERAKLTASTGQAGDRFGSGVAISNGLGLVGAPFETVGLLVDRGAVHRFNGLSDCTGNAVADACDIAAGLPDADGDGVPDLCEP